MTSTNRFDATTTSQAESKVSRLHWRQRYARNLWITDLIVLIWVVYGTQIAWLGFREVRLATGSLEGLPAVSYWAFSAVLIVVWMWALHLVDSRSHRVIGTGPTEYVRIARASLSLFGAIAIIAFLTKIDVARGYLLISLPIGVVTLMYVRWVWRRWLVSQRRSGGYSARVLLVGSPISIANIAHDLQRSTDAGFNVVGACTPTGQVIETIPNTRIPVLGSVDTIEEALHETSADTVVVTSSGDLPPGGIKRLSWALEAGRQHLILAPNITDIAGPRIHTRPISGLPLIHVETPRYTSGQRVVKRLMDVVLSAVGVVLISPVLIALALMVKATSRGPVLFRQTRVGLNGQEFQMLKFRSMVVNAERQLEALRAEQNAGNEILFKMSNDPRVTRVGRVMRRFSLDELPQLFNVIGGSMSLVGPRPPLPNEVTQYANHVHRRFLVKPGITGLWQVSGRSSLSWEESVRLDLSYVENWTMLTDVVILMRTLRAALLPANTAM